MNPPPKPSLTNLDWALDVLNFDGKVTPPSVEIAAPVMYVPVVRLTMRLIPTVPFGLTASHCHPMLADCAAICLNADQLVPPFVEWISPTRVCPPVYV